jgi:hypothetical protein
VVHTEVWDEVVLWMLIHISLELGWGCSLGLASYGSTSWDGLLFGKSITELSIWEELWEGILWYNPLVLQGCLGILEVSLRSDNIVVHTEVWDEVVLWMLIHISLELGWGSGLSLASNRSACWDGLLFSKSITELSIWEKLWEGILWNNPLVLQGFLGITEVVLGGDDIVIHTEVWDEIIFWMLIHISLELGWSGSLGLTSY